MTFVYFIGIFKWIFKNLPFFTPNDQGLTLILERLAIILFNWVLLKLKLLLFKNGLVYMFNRTQPEIELRRIELKSQNGLILKFTDIGKKFKFTYISI